MTDYETLTNATWVNLEPQLFKFKINHLLFDRLFAAKFNVMSYFLQQVSMSDESLKHFM